MIKITQLVFNPFQENTFVLYNDKNECIIVDPGCYEDNEKEQLNYFIKNNNLIPKRLINTHCHVDHVLGNSFVKNSYNVVFSIHKDDLPLLKRVTQHGIAFGLEIDAPPEMDEFLEEGSKISFGDSIINIIHVPGHSPGSIALYSEPDKFIMVGDVLFQGSIGRTDLPGGNHDTLINSIQKKLMVLPHDTLIYPGHGPSTTIGEEYNSNPF